jgi:protein TonB
MGGAGSFYLSIDYPEEARRRGIQGRVILDFIVNAQGRTQDVRVLQSLHPLCDSSAVAALKRTRFVPGKRNGEAIPVRMRLPVRFQLVNLTANNETP